MDNEQEKSQLPPFHLAELYPDAKSLLFLSLPALETIKDDAVIVLDTNSLVIPYTIQKKSLDEIRTAYQPLIANKRLYIPAQVVREFARIRAKKIQELFQKTARKQAIQSINVEKYPMLDYLPEYGRLIEMENELNTKIAEYRQSVHPILADIRLWNWNDPVSAIYRELFNKELIVEPSENAQEIEIDFARRIENRVPPGFKDSGKDDGGIGDIIIWKTILTLGAQSQKPLLFVTGEEKTDWMLRSENQPLYPRFELIDEYARASGGQPFYILKFSQLLDLFGVEQVVVDEVKKEEVEAIRTDVQQFSRSRKFIERAESAVSRWISRVFPNCGTVLKDRFPDFSVWFSRSRKIGFEVKAVRSGNEFSPRFLMKDLAYRIYFEKTEGGYSDIAVVFVYEDKESALNFTYSSLQIPGRPEISAIVGYLESEEFVPIFDDFTINLS